MSDPALTIGEIPEGTELPVKGTITLALHEAPGNDNSVHLGLGIAIDGPLTTEDVLIALLGAVADVANTAFRRTINANPPEDPSFIEPIMEQFDIAISSHLTSVFTAIEAAVEMIPTKTVPDARVE